MNDFITQLRTDLVAAAAREQERKPIGRALRSLDPRLWRPATIAGGLAIAVAIALAFLSVLLLAPNPTPPADNPHVVGAVRVGGIPVSAAFGEGSLWVTDFNGDVVRIDPIRRRVLARVATGDSPSAIRVGAGAVWARATTDDHRTRIVRIDPARERVVLRRAFSYGDGLAVGAGAVWIAQPGTRTARGGVLALAPGSGKVVASLPIANADGLALAGATLWIVGTDGTVTEVDIRSRRVIATFQRLASGADPTGADVLVADDAGAWAVDADRATIFRLADGRITRRIRVPGVQPLLANDRDSLWTATGDGLRHNVLTRISARSGAITTTIDLGRRRPLAIVPTASALYVVAADGTVLVVRGV